MRSSRYANYQCASFLGQWFRKAPGRLLFQASIFNTRASGRLLKSPFLLWAATWAAACAAKSRVCPSTLEILCSLVGRKHRLAVGVETRGVRFVCVIRCSTFTLCLFPSSNGVFSCVLCRLLNMRHSVCCLAGKTKKE